MPVRFEREGKIAVLTLDRPEKHNAMDSEMYGQISERLLEIDRDDGIWVGIVTGAGDKAFTAGADLVTMHAPGGEATARCSPSVGHAVVPVFFIVTAREPVEGAPGGRTSLGATDCVTTEPSFTPVIRGAPSVEAVPVLTTIRLAPKYGASLRRVG